MADLNKHVKGDKAKWWITLVAGVMAFAAIGALFAKMNKDTGTEQIGFDKFIVGGVDEKGIETDTDATIRTWGTINADGLTVEVKKNANVTYKVFFYDKNKKFISATDEMTGDFNGVGIPVGAKTANVVITPVDDEDGTVSIFELNGYASQLIITVDK